MSRTLVIVTKSLAPYRVRFYQEVAACLNPFGWEVALLTAMAAAKDHPWLHLGDDRPSPIRIIEIGGGLEDCASGFLKALFKNRQKDFALPSRRLYQWLQELDPELVWTHEYSPFCLGAAHWASLKDRISILSTDLGDNPPPYSCSPRGLIFHRMVSFLYQAVIAQTPEATRRSEPSGIPVILAPHAIDTAEYVPDAAPKPDTFRFLFTGALDGRKGIKRVVAAGRRLAAEGVNFELRVLGSGPFSEWLSEQGDPWISIGGFVEGGRLREEYRNADAYVLPTSGDTYAVTVHEAAASGLPLIVGKTAGAVETLVVEGVTGHAIDASNENELLSRMREFAINPGKAEKMGRAARQVAESYDVKHLGRKTAEFLINIANGLPATGKP